MENKPFMRGFPITLAFVFTFSGLFSACEDVPDEPDDDDSGKEADDDDDDNDSGGNDDDDDNDDNDDSDGCPNICKLGDFKCQTDFTYFECVKGADGCPTLSNELKYCGEGEVCGSGKCAKISSTAGFCKACVADLSCKIAGSLCGHTGGGYYCLSPCKSDGDCESAATCVPLNEKGSFLGNYCIPKSGDCNVAPKAALGDDCSLNEECTTNICVLTSDDSGFCGSDCLSDRGCPSGFVCAPTMTDSDGDYEYDSYAGSCTPIEDGSLETGDECSFNYTDDQCASYMCKPGEAPGRCPNALSCQSECEDDDCFWACVDEDGADCQECVYTDYVNCLNENECLDEEGYVDEDCEADYCLDIWYRCYVSAESACTTSCETDSDCPETMACKKSSFTVDAGEAEWKVCTIPAEAITCRPTNGGVEVCDSADNNCDGSVDEGGVCNTPASGVDTITLNMGKMELFGTGQVSKVMEFDLPENAISFSIIMKNMGTSIGMVAYLWNPDGKNIQPDMKPYAFDGAYAITVPNTPDITIKKGKWKFSVVNWESRATVEVLVVIKVGKLPQKSTLSMNIFLVGLTDLNASKAASDADFQKLIAEVDALYMQQGITLDLKGAKIYDLNEDKFAFIDSTEGVNSELRQMFAKSSIAKEEGRVNVFLVRTIASLQAGFITLGIAGGIPGPVGINGTVSSGVAVGMDSYGTSWRKHISDIASTWAHEMGHFLGLFHTSEADGKSHDPLSDTPQCPSSNDKNGDGYLLPDECKGKGAENLMFWAASPESKDVTANQGFVVQHNTAIK
ncbi:MAG: hypothetical protein Kow0090_04600 [Myxococcota bacterium]